MRQASTALLKGVRLLLLLLIVLSLSMLAFWNLKIGEMSLSELWERADGMLLTLALLFISLSMPFVALRWRAFFPQGLKQKSSTLMLTGFLAAAFVFNLALPGPVGEALSAAMVRRKYKLSFSHALASLGLSRILGLASACGISGLVYWLAPFDIPENWAFILQSSALFLILCSLGLLFVAFFPKQTSALLNSIPHPQFLAPLWNAASRFLQALQETLELGWKSYLESFFWALLGHTMVAFGIYIATIAIGVNASWSAILFTYAASIAASIVMFMLPGSSVGWDLLFATTLSAAAQIELIEAGAITAIIRIQQLLVALLGAGVVWKIAEDLLEEAFQDLKKNEKP